MMYGIMTEDGNLVLCQSYRNETYALRELDLNGNLVMTNSGVEVNKLVYFLKRWDRNGNLVMKSSATEVDQLLQDFCVVSNRYDLVVFKFTEEQEQKLLIKRLKGI